MLGFLPFEIRRMPRRESLALLAPPAPAAAAPPLPLGVRDVPDAETFQALSVPAGDLVANGRVVKFLVDLRAPDRPEIHFINGTFTENGDVPDAARFHWVFARRALAIPEGNAEFNRLTYFTPGRKRYAAGVLHSYFLDGSDTPLYGVQFYPQDVIAEEVVLQVVSIAAAAVTIPDGRLAFVATGSQQTVVTVRDRLADLGVAITSVDQVLGAVRYIPLNTGEAFGHLRIFPATHGELTPADIPVFDELPLDLSVVAGVITRAVQDASSHVNLKSKERGTPNMVLRDAAPQNPRLAPWADRPVHLVVRGDDFLLEATTDEEIARRLAERNNRPWIPLSWEPETRIRSYDEMAAGTREQTLAFNRRYGSKAANLGFLAHRQVLGRIGDTGSPSERAGYDLVPLGFGIPLSFYRNLVDHPANGRLRQELDALVDAEKSGTLSPAERARRVDSVQTCFLNATVPPDDLAAVRAAFAELLPTIKKVKIRSSANAEDVPNFDGAGLHDSFTATVTKKDNPDGSCAFELEDEPGGEVKRKVTPRSVACAIKGVYASLWNQRAIEERTFARIDHATVAMGLSVVPVYDTESDVAANAVIVTRVINASGIFGYSLSVQQGNNLATNPDPGTETELTVAALGLGDEPTSLTVTRFAKPTADGPRRTDPVLPESEMLGLVDLATIVERAYCAAKPGYYPGGDCRFVVIDAEKPTSLDMELKILENGRLVCKQVREFGGR